MKSLFSLILVISLLSGGLRTISRINEYAAIAADAYHREDYVEAITAYEYLLDDLEVQDDQLRLNLGHAYFRAGQLQQAQQSYTLLANHSSNHIRAVALLQLGNIAVQGNKYKQALAYFRQSLIASPDNEAARYNYELVKKYLQLNPEQQEEATEEAIPSDDQQQPEQYQPDSLDQTPPPDEEQQAPKPKTKPDPNGDREEEIETQEQADAGQQEQQGADIGQNKPNKGNSDSPGARDKEEASGKEQGDTKGFNPDNNFDPARPERSRSNDPASEAEHRAQTRNSRLQQMNISPQRARLMLEAIRNAEQQYIQQLPKKMSKKPDSSKPDW
jgi:hypothetical protein